MLKIFEKDKLEKPFSVNILAKKMGFCQSKIFLVVKTSVFLGLNMLLVQRYVHFSKIFLNAAYLAQ